MAKIKIVQVITRLIKGGAQKVCLDITEGLPKDRYEVFLLSGPETGLEGSLWDKAKQIQGVNINTVPELVREISPIKDLLALFRLYYFFSKISPDIVHCHTSKAGFIGCLAGWLARVPVIIFSPHGHLFSPTAKIPSVSHGTLRMQFFYFLTKLAYLLSTKVIAQNSADRDEQIKLRLGPASKYKIIHNAVEIKPVAPAQSGNKNYPILATVGRLSAEKGQVYLLEALKSVRKEFPDTQLLVIGDGILRKELETFVEKENLNNNVRFTGLCDDPSQLLKDIDIFVLPSLYESFGIVLLEAMAQGKPVIASNVNGIPEVVTDGETGILVPPANPGALSEAIIKLTRDKELAKKMGQAGYERVKKLFRREQMVDNFDNLYRKLYRPISEVIHDSAASIKSPHPPFAKGEKGGLEELKMVRGQNIKTANRAVYNAKTVAQYEENPSIFEPARQAGIKNIITFISAKISAGTPSHQNPWCGGKFLDIGCGTGNVLKIARHHFGLAIGVDIAEKFLRQVKKLHPELDLIAADSNRLPFKNNAFNCISLYGALHHLFDPARTLGRISPLLKPNGYLYTDHDPNYFFNRFYHLYYRLKHRSPGFGSRQEELAEFHNTQTGGINPESLKKRLLNSGFQDIQVHYRHTTNPSLPRLERLGLALLKASARLAPLKSFYTHFYIIGKR